MRALWTGLLTLALGTSPVAVPATGSAGLGDSLPFGTATLTRCDLGVGRPTYCGRQPVRLNPASRTEGFLGIFYAVVPAANATTPAAVAASPTIVAQEGGPGYPSSGTAASYAEMYAASLSTHNLLVMDARGTGRSAPIDCRRVEALAQPPALEPFLDAARACGNLLDHTWKDTAGNWVHASDLFTTANAGSDLVTILDRLGIRRIDLYGDSYGTYFAQSFLARHPDRLRSATLDSAYVNDGLDPWYLTSVQTMRRAFVRACGRSPACASATDPEAAWTRIGRLAAVLRAHPLTGVGLGTDGRPHRMTVTVSSLVNMVNDAGYDIEHYRQLDAAARAYHERRDGKALLREWGQSLGWDYSDYVGQPASYYSDGDYLAVGCTDYPQLFDMRATRAERRRQLTAAIAKQNPKAFAPFSIREWLTVNPFTEMYTGCLTWPAPTHRPVPPVPPGGPLNPGHVPVLVLNGDLDSLTPAADGIEVARQAGPTARHVLAANTVHLVALDNPWPCGRSIVNRFVQRPSAIHQLDVSCAATIPAPHTVGTFPSRLSDAPVAAGAGPRLLARLATIAAGESADAVNRWFRIDGSRDAGLRGGRITYTDNGSRTVARLDRVRYTTDTMMSGRVVRGGSRVTADLMITDPGGGRHPVALSWSLASRSPATVRIDGMPFRVPAP